MYYIKFINFIRYISPFFVFFLCLCMCVYIYIYIYIYVGTWFVFFFIFVRVFFRWKRAGEHPVSRPVMKLSRTMISWGGSLLWVGTPVVTRLLHWLTHSHSPSRPTTARTLAQDARPSKTPYPFIRFLNEPPRYIFVDFLHCASSVSINHFLWHIVFIKFIYVWFETTFLLGFSGATLSLPTTSPLHPPLPLHCHPARHRQHWLMSWYRPPSQKLIPAVRWTGPTTPTNQDTASATRCVHVTSLLSSIPATLLFVVLLLWFWYRIDLLLHWFTNYNSLGPLSADYKAVVWQ